MISAFLQILIGIIIADLVSGALHWAQDNVPGEEWPLIGGFFKDGRIHHEQPEKFLSATIWGRSHLAFVGGAIGALVGTLIFGWQFWVLSASLAFALMIEIQVWAHRKPEDRPQWVRALQFVGLMQSIDHHADHHDTGGNYCVITDWCNPIVNRVFRFVGRST